MLNYLTCTWYVVTLLSQKWFFEWFWRLCCKENWREPQCSETVKSRVPSIIMICMKNLRFSSRLRAKVRHHWCHQALPEHSPANNSFLMLQHFWAMDVNRKWTFCIIGQWFGWNSWAGLLLRGASRGRGFSPATKRVVRPARLLLLENRRKIEPKEIPSRLIPRLLVVFTRQLEILVTTLLGY